MINGTVFRKSVNLAKKTLFKMKNEEWFLFNLEKMNKTNRNIAYMQRVDYNFEKKIIEMFLKNKDKFFDKYVALDISKRWNVLFVPYVEEFDMYVWMNYNKKEKRWDYISYKLNSFEQYIFLKHSPFLQNL
jgi:hypothetical protein